MVDLDWGVDRSNMVDLLRNFPLQCEEAIAIGKDVEVGYLSGGESVVVTGMGGSAMGGDLLRACLSDEVDIPIWVNRDYSLPGWVGKRTLVFVSSYSGNTEETLSAYEEGKRRDAKLVSLTSGGKLEKLSKKDGYPLVKIPSGLPPRCGLGYLFFPMFIVLSRTELVKSKGDEIEEALAVLRQMAGELCQSRNQAIELAGRFVGKLPVFYSSNRFEVVVRRWGTQFNENSKTFAHTNLLPELNHNEIVGWDQPENLLKDAEIVFLRDGKEHPQVRRRFEITKELLKPLASGVYEVWSRGEGLLSRLFSLIYFGDYLSYYLALLLGVDPTPIERIDYLKGKLK